MKQLLIDEIHTVTLDLMDKLHQICEENDIKYSIMYGTLIGAIRHKGFIPWDDDFDICMMREDYNRFVQIVNEMHDARYKIASRANTKNYYNGIVRFYDSNYLYVTELKTHQYEIGVFIDVYPLDACGGTKEATEQVHSMVRHLNAKYMVYCNKFSLTSKARSIIRVPYHYILKAQYGRKFPDVIDSMVEKEIYKHFNQESDGVAVYWEDINNFRIFQRSWFDERILADFEDRKYWIPKEYDKILTLQYGDYMSPPPENQRIATHDYKMYRKEDFS